MHTLYNCLTYSELIQSLIELEDNMIFRSQEVCLIPTCLMISGRGFKILVEILSVLQRKRLEVLAQILLVRSLLQSLLLLSRLLRQVQPLLNLFLRSVTIMLVKILLILQVKRMKVQIRFQPARRLLQSRLLLRQYQLLLQVQQHPSLFLLISVFQRLL